MQKNRGDPRKNDPATASNDRTRTPSGGYLRLS